MLTEEQLRTVRELWNAGVTQGEVAEKVGLSMDTLKARLRDQLADLPPRPRRINSGRRARLPTEEEIYGTLTLIEQATWSDEEREARWRGCSVEELRRLRGVGRTVDDQGLDIEEEE